MNRPRNDSIPSQSAFSLVELSIVLVILGLLVGGVLSGQSLIRAAELRSVSTEFHRWISATHSFRDKYFALPGDMTNATRFWGVAAAGAACKTTAGTGTQTCDGNGSGFIEGDPAFTGEEFRFWQHLANAGLVEGRFSGTSTANEATKANVPSSKFSNALWFMTYQPDYITASTYVFDGWYKNYLMIGAFSAGQAPFTPVFKAEDAWNIDTKLDDGKPATGKITVDCQNLSACTTTVGGDGSNLNASYLLTSSAITTSLQFRNLF